MNRTLRWGFALALLPIAACTSNTPPADTAAAPPPPPALSAADQTFIAAAAASDAFETQTSQLAQDKARRAAVKSFANDMIQQHGQMDQQLTTLAQSKGTTVTPTLTAEQQQMLTMLQGESGARFERDYLRGQVMGHQQTVAAFQAEIDGGQDADIKAFAQSGLPAIQQHLATARRLSGIREPGAASSRRPARHSSRRGAASSTNG